MTLHWLDLLVLGGYFVCTIWIGLLFSRRSKTTDDYFLGGRSFPGWAIGISLIGSMVSSITFLAYPADAFKTAWVRFLPNLAFPVVVLIAAYAFIPFFRGGQVSSAYQYLALRFGPKISAYAAILFLLSQIVRAATITYLVALLLAPMLGLRVEWCILLAGGVTALYSVKGGFSAVVWTEVIQTVVLILGAVVSIGSIVWLLPGGFSQIVSEASAAGKLSFMDLNVATGALEPLVSGFSLSEKTVSMLFLVGFVQYLTGKLDQTTVQRWCAAKTASEARKSMLVLGIGSLPIWGGFMFLGTCLWVYFQHHPDPMAQAILGGAQKAENIVPHFIIHVLPPGLAGLVIAAAMAAAMSTLGGCISATSMVWVTDIYRPFIEPKASEGRLVRMGLVSSVAISLAMIVGAYFFYKSDTKTFTDLGIIMASLLGGGISSAFLLGMLTRVGDERSVLVGIVCTLVFTTYALLGQFGVLKPVFDLYYTALLGNGIMLASSYLSGLLLKSRRRDLKGLTVWDRARSAA